MRRYTGEELAGVEIALDQLKSELGRMDVQDWMQDAVVTAHRVQQASETRMVEVPEDTSRNGYRDMEDFIDTVEDPTLAKLLAVAIDGRGAFRRFKDVLYEYPDEREGWFAFQKTQVRQRMLDWLASEGIEPGG